jgi:hypothetical protein
MKIGSTKTRTIFYLCVLAIGIAKLVENSPVSSLDYERYSSPTFIIAFALFGLSFEFRNR